MKEGQRVIDLLACRRCHSSAGRGNSLTTNLDGAALRKTPKELVQSIRNPATNMPDFALTEEQMTVLINAIYSGSLARKPDQIAPVKVHFNSAGRKDPDIFSTKCGSCHRIISARLGAVGTGDIGPNLSGLFSGFYPKTFRNDEVWTTKNLDTWLKNPRVIRPWARMQPVLLNEIETREIESVIGSVSNNSASKEGR